MGCETITTEWVTATVRRLVESAPGNRLADFAGQKIFDTPLVGVADGDDPVFERFAVAVSERHAMPREILARSCSGDTAPSAVSVISWVLPFTREVRESNRGNGWPSKLYSVARNNGGALNFDLRRWLVDALRARGVPTVSPPLEADYDVFRSDRHVFSSSWSERHVAYAAGLGYFGLSAGLITPAGVCVRLGSVVAGIALPPRLRREEDYRANCLKNGGADCGRCVERCPVGAISRGGHCKTTCHEMRKAVRVRSLDAYTNSMDLHPAPVVKSGQRTQGFSLGCALCQCGVPCESADPYAWEEDCAGREIQV